MAALNWLPSCPHTSLPAESQEGQSVGVAVLPSGMREVGHLPIVTAPSLASVLQMVGLQRRLRA